MIKEKRVRRVPLETVESPPEKTDKGIENNVQKLLEDFFSKFDHYSEKERNEIIRAARWAAELHRDQKRASGEPYIIHPVTVAEQLINLNLDYKAIIAALLHDIIEDTDVTRGELRKEFGREVESLVHGVTKISFLRGKSKTIQEAETIRKMLFAMVKDIRVIFIKLSDKLHNMRTLQYLDAQSRKRIASECLDIYAPLAGRLGISKVRVELEDLSLKYLHPDVYEQIKRFVAENRKSRAEFLERVKNDIASEAKKAGIPVDLETRAKHFYSIYQKMRKRGKPIEEIYDLLGIRILTETTSQCYELLGLVHKLFIPISGRFKDYIAMPKSNRYQSLHTTVMGYNGKMVEIQIRTHKMHRTAENGIAAHFIYKKGSSREIVKQEDLPIINKLKSWDGAKAASSEFLEEIKRELLKDSIYVFTPRGDVIELPKGSTAIDFAYHIHTEIGNHCLAAKADGVIIPLKQELKSTQVVEIITSNTAHPHLNWLRYVKTARARSKVRHWLNQNDTGLIIDRNIIAKRKESAKTSHAEKRLPRESLRYEISGRGTEKKGIEETEKRILDQSRIGIRIDGERNMMIRLAKCCNPTTGDRIIGYISRGRGIIVHRADCPNLKYIKDFSERKIEVEWETVSPRATRRFQVTSRMIPNLFSEIEGALKKYNGHLIEGKLDESDGETLKGFFTVELDNRDDFSHVLKNLRTIPAIINIQSMG